MNTIKAIRKPGIIVQDAGEEMMLYSAETEAIHILNPTARHIWDLCDGEHTVKDMEQSLRAIFDIPSEYDLTSDIQGTLEAFRGKGLLQ